LIYSSIVWLRCTNFSEARSSGARRNLKEGPMMPGKAYIGTSGWNYKSWRDDFYAETPQKRWLRFCAEGFTGIEVNGTFYRLQEKSTFKKWAARIQHWLKENRAVHVYFDNDAEGAAPPNALSLLEMLRIDANLGNELS
jgi:uncharacterized protein YecE (DUF72 family)